MARSEENDMEWYFLGGSNEGRALRGVADRLLAVLVAMLKQQSPYDPRRRQHEVQLAA
jgi:hypothetical protein